MAHSPNASLNIFQSNGRLMCRWPEPQRQAFARLKDTLNLCARPLLRHSCTHVKGNFGVRGAIRACYRASQQGFIYVARFDVAQYYRSMDHRIMRQQLAKLPLTLEQFQSLNDYLTLNGLNTTGKGMVASGSLSPLLAAIYLSPLDRTMAKFLIQNICYWRYMDDFVILAKNRRAFKRALKRAYQVLQQLELTLHATKRFIGKVSKGFDFLGFHFNQTQGLSP